MGIVTVVIVLIVILIAILASSVCIVPQAQQWVIERLGSFHEVWDSGIHFKWPVLVTVRKKVTTSEMTFDVPPQKVITKDNVEITADSFIFFKVQDPQLFAYGVNDPASAMSALAVSTLRDIIGKMDLEECLSSRDLINKSITKPLDEATDQWGIKVMRVEIKNFAPPRNILESMERQMKAERERREQVIRAQADKEAAMLEAEKNKSVQIMNAEAAFEAAQKNAEAARIAIVRKAEAEREAILLRADAEKEYEVKKAQAQAEAIRIVQQATADGIRAVNASAPSEAALRLKAYEAFGEAANGQATKIIVPSDMQGMVGMASALKDILK